MLDKEVQTRIRFLNEKYACVICPICLSETDFDVFVMFNDISSENFHINARNKCDFMVKLAKHLRAKFGF